MSRTFVANGGQYGYHDFLNPHYDPIDKDGKLIFILDLLIQAGVDSPNIPEAEDFVIEAFEHSSFGIYIKLSGVEYWLKAANMGSDEACLEKMK